MRITDYIYRLTTKIFSVLTADFVPRVVVVLAGRQPACVLRLARNKNPLANPLIILVVKRYSASENNPERFYEALFLFFFLIGDWY